MYKIFIRLRPLLIIDDDDSYILILGRQAQFNLNQASLEQNKENRPFPLQNKTSSYSILLFTSCGLEWRRSTFYLSISLYNGENQGILSQRLLRCTIQDQNPCVPNLTRRNHVHFIRSTHRHQTEKQACN